MARIRTIKPEMPSDEALARVGRDARLTFVYLITQVDDDGLLPAAPRQLLGALYPHDHDVTEAMLLAWCAELVAIGAVRWRETRGGSRVIEVVNWAKHQRIKHRAKSVLLPSLKPPADILPPSSLNPPATLPPFAGEPPENRTTFSAPELVPSTLDLGPRTLDQVQHESSAELVTDCGPHRIALVKAANAGITALWGEQPSPIRWDAPATSQACDVLATAAVPLDFAVKHAHALASTKRPSNGRPPGSLSYFALGIVDAWREQASLAAADVSDDDAMAQLGVTYARDGNAEWQAWCDERGIAWKVAS